VAFFLDSMKQLFVLLAAAVHPALAQVADTLQEVQVQAAMVTTRFEVTPRQVVVLDRKVIEALPVISVNEIMEYALGVDVRQRGPLDVQADVQLRGGTFEQTLVLVNGIRMNDLQTGHHNMNLPVAADEIERIEVLLGGGSRVYGQGAMAGSINIITRKDGPGGLRLWANGGSYGTYQVGARELIQGTNHYTTVGFQRTASDGYRTNTDFFHNQASLNSSIRAGGYDVEWTSGYAWKGFGAQDFYSSTYPTQYEATRTLLAGLKVSSGSKLRIERQVYYRRHTDRFELFRETGGPYVYSNGQFIRPDSVAAPAWYTGHNYHQTQAYGGSLKGKYTYQGGTTSMGLDYRGEDIKSNVLGQPLEAPQPVPNSRGVYTLGGRRDHFSGYVEQSLFMRGWYLSAGALVNYTTGFDWDVLPGLDISYNRERWTAYGSINRSFRFPTYTELYYNRGGAVGSLGLQPEYSLNLELGMRYTRGAWMAGLALFQRNGENLIDWVKLPGDSVVRARNITQVTMNGVEGRAQWLNPKAGGMLRRAAFTAAWQQTAEGDFAFESLYVLDYLSLKVGLSADVKLWKGLLLGAEVNYQDRNGQFSEAGTGQLVDFPSVLLVDAKLRYVLSAGEAFISVNNLLNQAYFDRGNIPMPGTWITAGFSALLKH
jgi:iron complex outermembrane receptor protein